MFRTIKNEKFENKEIVAVEYDGVYTVCAYVDDILVGAFDTKGEKEAQEVYALNVYEMYA